jgi:hypothetical protein
VKPRKKDAATVLAEKMVQELRHRQRCGEDNSPLTLEQLARLADAAASAKTILSAVHPGRKAFGQHALVARKDLRAPVALLDELPHLAASPALLQFALETTRTTANHVSSVAELKNKLTVKLRSPFQEAVQRQLAADALPSGVGWILVKSAKKLLLLKDLHTSPASRGHQRPEREVLPAPPVADAPRPPARLEFARAFDEAFARLDRQQGSHNFVSLVELRRAVPVSRQVFDAELRQLRLAGKYTLSAAEGRHGVNAAEQESGITEDGTLLLYVSRKSP